jgi:hypothetical protein
LHSRSTQMDVLVSKEVRVTNQMGNTNRCNGTTEESCGQSVAQAGAYITYQSWELKGTRRQVVILSTKSSMDWGAIRTKINPSDYSVTSVHSKSVHTKP